MNVFFQIIFNDKNNTESIQVIFCIYIKFCFVFVSSTLCYNYITLIKLQLTNPKMLTITAVNLDNVNLSPPLLGKKAARNKTNKLDIEDNIVTILASVCSNDI